MDRRWARRVAVVAGAVAVVAAGCGDPRSLGAPSTSTAPATTTTVRVSAETSTSSSVMAAALGPTSGVTPTSVAAESASVPSAAAPRPIIRFPGSVAFCDDPPIAVGPAVDGDAPVSDDQMLAREALGPSMQAVVDAHKDVFTALWWDANAQQFAFSGTDRTAMEAVIATVVPKEVSYRVEVVAHLMADLQDLQARLTPAVSNAGVANSSGIRPDGRIEIFLAIREEASVRAVTELAGSDVDAVCVSGGADPATVARNGPQPAGGDGWRLLADAPNRPNPVPLEVAVTSAGYDAMWSRLALEGAPPAVDLRTEIVLAFVAGESSGCPNRLDAVVFDRGARLVRPNVVFPGGDRACRSDLRHHTYVIALERDHLPGAPFQITARNGECSAGCDGDPITIDKL